MSISSGYGVLKIINLEWRSIAKARQAKPSLGVLMREERAAANISIARKLDCFATESIPALHGNGMGRRANGQDVEDSILAVVVPFAAKKAGLGIPAFSEPSCS